jgi:hypothetical protein
VHDVYLRRLVPIGRGFAVAQDDVLLAGARAEHSGHDARKRRHRLVVQDALGQD